MKNNIKNYLLVAIALAFAACDDPELSAPTGEVPENAQSGYTVSQISIVNTGNRSLESLVLTGSGAENFSVNLKGLITVASTAQLDFETMQGYNLTATATSTKGDTVSGSVNINILDVADVVPIISGFKASLPEDTPQGSLVGQITVNDTGDSQIQTYRVSDSGRFYVTNTGEVRTNITLDYEQQIQYNFSVYAISAAGESNKVNVELTVSNIADVIPWIMGFDTSVNKNIKIGSVIGKVSIEREGDSPISKFTISEPDAFEVSLDGVVTTKTLLDKSSYALEVVVTNTAGTDTGLVQITVNESFNINFINGHSVSDIDSDGDLDVIDVLATNGEVQWHDNQGNNQFITHSLPFTSQLVFAQDMDNDGDTDIVSRDGSDIVIYLNDGNQNFTESQRITRDYGFHYDSNGIYLADINSDGRIDIIAAWMGQDWYKNEEDGSFTRLPLSSRGKDIIAFDIDLDGDMDFIESDNNVFWHENNGSQAFTAHQLSDDDIGGASSYSIDIDNDGDIDIVSTRRWTNGIDLYVNDGLQNFSKILVSMSNNSGYTYATDIDNDGYIDVLNGTVWYKNDGYNNFIKQPALSLDNQTLVNLANK
ncbi:MAG: hypothetical protein COB67_00385 [SAR324 cluster bacterium]|uniref:Cadherin domain-containing protein n=1 Tax=SAR324 cluster bacterium TaxID=2024889 RepID=A0A2A4TBF4_9DELT|nr:MAG: hypothetical protein COB67_00385 [SAR324 cluster bacterium]